MMAPNRFKANIVQPIAEADALLVERARSGAVTWPMVPLYAQTAVRGANPNRVVEQWWETALLYRRISVFREAQRWLIEHDRPADQLTNVYLNERMAARRLEVVLVFADRDAALLYKLAN